MSWCLSSVLDKIKSLAMPALPEPHAHTLHQDATHLYRNFRTCDQEVFTRIKQTVFRRLDQSGRHPDEVRLFVDKHKYIEICADSFPMLKSQTLKVLERTLLSEGTLPPDSVMIFMVEVDIHRGCFHQTERPLTRIVVHRDSTFDVVQPQ